MEMVQQAREQETQKTSLQNVQSVQQFRGIVAKICPRFKVTEFNKIVLNELFYYATRNPIGKLDTNKGIFLHGEIGTGKSTLIKILAEFQRLYGNGFKTVNCASVAAYFASYGIDSLNEHTWNDTWNGVHPCERAFDELGKETIPAKHYGNELNVMQHVIQIRYDLKVKTHITSNMQPGEIETKYGSHIYDRAIEMFNFIELKGESFRK
jgi:ATPase subunit of ABC transporter with duplicated ATPase domains